MKDPDDRYPELKLISTKKDSALFETIEMKVNVKNELVPPDYWDFVHGHPGSRRDSRPLFPFEVCPQVQWSLYRFKSALERFPRYLQPI